MAGDVLQIAAEEYAKSRKELPGPSSFEDVKVWAEKNLDELGNPGLFRIQAYNVPNVDLTPIRVSISFTKATLAKIDQNAKALGMTRSGYLSVAGIGYRAG